MTSHFYRSKPIITDYFFLLKFDSGKIYIDRDHGDLKERDGYIILSKGNKHIGEGVETSWVGDDRVVPEDKLISIEKVDIEEMPYEVINHLWLGYVMVDLVLLKKKPTNEKKMKRISEVKKRIEKERGIPN